MAVKKKNPKGVRVRDASELTRVEVNKGEAPRYYANSIIITPAFFDFRIQFGEILDVGQEEMLIREKAVVYISPQHAKALRGLLDGRIAFYEEHFGPIPEASPETTPDE